MNDTKNVDMLDNELVESNINKDVCQHSGNKEFNKQNQEFTFLQLYNFFPKENQNNISAGMTKKEDFNNEIQIKYNQDDCYNRFNQPYQKEGDWKVVKIEDISDESFKQTDKNVYCINSISDTIINISKTNSSDQDVIIVNPQNASWKTQLIQISSSESDKQMIQKLYEFDNVEILQHFNNKNDIYFNVILNKETGQKLETNLCYELLQQIFPLQLSDYLY